MRVDAFEPGACFAVHSAHPAGPEKKEKVYAVRRDRETSDRPWRPVAALS